MFNLVSFVIRSRNRIVILNALDSPKTPTQLAKELDIHRSAVSRDILKLVGRGLVECLSPKEKVFRLYRITEKGQKILKEVGKLED